MSIMPTMTRRRRSTSVFIGRNCLGDGGEHFGHGAQCLGVGCDGVGHIYKGNVDAGTRRGKEVTAETVCLAASAAHLHTVHGVAQAFFWHGDEELRHLGAMGVDGPDHAPRVCHNGSHRRVGMDAPGAK